jgi:hypothetical protein
MDRFARLDAIHFHRTNPALDVFNKECADKDLLANPIEVVTCVLVVGFKGK